ncbi:MAG: hypothetical protein J5I93_28565 [Pirellulaceae bacterium]|nr:hypothetical protein [Pirellulaceae bacterium]
MTTDQMPGDIYIVDPLLVEIGEELSRQQSRSTEEIVAMAISLHTQGQRRAVECRKVEGDRLVLAHGYVRTMAARMVCSGFKHTSQNGAEVRIKDRRFKLKVILVP